MRKIITIAVIFILLSILGGCGRSVLLGKHERKVQLQASLKDGHLVVLNNKNGSIVTTGADIQECRVDAVIHVKASDDEAARRISEEEIRIKLVPREKTLLIEVEKPDRNDYNLSIAYDVKVPRKTHLDFSIHNGSLQVEHLTGTLTGKAHNGNITCRSIEGDVKLKTHNGKLRLEKVSGDLKLTSLNDNIVAKEIMGNLHAQAHNGKIIIVYSQKAPKSREVWVKNNNGKIEYTGPKGFSAIVELEVKNGSINTEVPMKSKIQGHKSLKGTIGEGTGKLFLKTNNGSIWIKQAE